MVEAGGPKIGSCLLALPRVIPRVIGVCSVAVASMEGAAVPAPGFRPLPLSCGGGMSFRWVLATVLHAIGARRHTEAVGLLLVLATFGGASLGKGQTDRGEPLCYAFLKGDNLYAKADLYLKCGGKPERITTEKDIRDFAVAADGSALALSRQTGTEKSDEGDDIPRVEIELVSLNQDFRSHWCPRDEGNTELEASCGTVVAVSHASWGPSGGFRRVDTARDALTGKLLSFDPYLTFRCSSDRKAIVGHINTDRRVLMAGLPPQRQVVRAPAGSIVAPYDISPDGHYVAYVTNALCVDDNGKNVGCVRGWGTYPERISVSSSMEILLDGGTGETCFQDPRGHWSVNHQRGYDDVEECTAVSYWRPGRTKLEAIEMFARDPQWITPEAAAALRAWRSHLVSSQRGRQR